MTFDDPFYKHGQAPAGGMSGHREPNRIAGFQVVHRQPYLPHGDLDHLYPVGHPLRDERAGGQRHTFQYNYADTAGPHSQWGEKRLLRVGPNLVLAMVPTGRTYVNFLWYWFDPDAEVMRPLYRTQVAFSKSGANPVTASNQVAVSNRQWNLHRPRLVGNDWVMVPITPVNRADPSLNGGMDYYGMGMHVLKLVGDVRAEMGTHDPFGGGEQKMIAKIDGEFHVANQIHPYHSVGDHWWANWNFIDDSGSGFSGGMNLLVNSSGYPFFHEIISGDVTNVWDEPGAQVAVALHLEVTRDEDTQRMRGFYGEMQRIDLELPFPAVIGDFPNPVDVPDQHEEGAVWAPEPGDLDGPLHMWAYILESTPGQSGSGFTGTGVHRYRLHRAMPPGWDLVYHVGATTHWLFHAGAAPGTEADMNYAPAAPEPALWFHNVDTGEEVFLGRASEEGVYWWFSDNRLYPNDPVNPSVFMRVVEQLEVQLVKVTDGLFGAVVYISGKTAASDFPEYEPNEDNNLYITRKQVWWMSMRYSPNEDLMEGWWEPDGLVMDSEMGEGYFYSKMVLLADGIGPGGSGETGRLAGFRTGIEVEHDPDGAAIISANGSRWPIVDPQGNIVENHTWVYRITEDAITRKPGRGRHGMAKVPNEDVLTEFGGDYESFYEPRTKVERDINTLAITAPEQLDGNPTERAAIEAMPLGVPYVDGDGYTRYASEVYWGPLDHAWFNNVFGFIVGWPTLNPQDGSGYDQECYFHLIVRTAGAARGALAGRFGQERREFDRRPQ